VSGVSRVATLSAFWILLGCWIGGMLFFALVIAPTAFRELPRELAGVVASHSLRVLHLYGGAAGVVLAGLTLLLGRGLRLAALPLLLAAACLYSHFGITGEMAELHPRAFGPTAEAAARARYNQLHGRSMWVYTLVGAGALLLPPLHVLRGERERGAGGPERS